MKHCVHAPGLLEHEHINCSPHDLDGAQVKLHDVAIIGCPSHMAECAFRQARIAESIADFDRNSDATRSRPSTGNAASPTTTPANTTTGRSSLSFTKPLNRETSKMPSGIFCALCRGRRDP